MTRNWNVRRAAVFAVVVLCAGRAGAEGPEEPEATPAEASVVLDEIEVKSGRPPGVETLEVREVRETSARDLGEALDRSAGVAKVRKAGIANDLVLRGMKKDDVSVRIDGAAVHGACPARMDPPAFHLDYAEVDRVEVRRGPFDVSQPGGLSGSVDVRTRGLSHRGVGGELTVGGGETGALETSAVAGWSGQAVDVLLGGAFKQARPFVSGDGRNFTEAIPDSKTSRFRDTSGEGDAYDVRSGWAKVGLATGDGQRLELAYTRQQAKDVLYPFLAMDGLRDDTDRLNATWRAGATGPFRTLLAQAYWSAVAHDMDDRERCSSAGNVAACTGALPEAWSMRTEARSQVWGAKLEASAGDVTTLRAGADFYDRTWDNTTTRVARAMPGMPYRSERQIPDVTIRDAGAYLELRRPLAASLRAIAGVRADLARSSAGVDRTALYEVFHPGSTDRERTDLLFGGNVQLEWDAAEGATVTVGYGHGTRLPDPQERYIALGAMAATQPSWVGDPSLRPVKNDELDVGFRLSRGGVLVKAQAFHAWLSDHVTLANVSGTQGAQTVTARTYANVAARTWGGEASVRAALPWKLFARVGASLVQGRNESWGTELAELPPLTGSLALRWDDGRFFAEVEEVLAARQDRVDARLQEQPTGGWAVTNVRLGAEWQGGRLQGAKVFAGVTNLFDRMYVEHLSYQRDPFASGVKVPEPGRILYASVQVAF